MNVGNTTSNRRSVILVTGMSGTGKSSVLAELARRRHHTVDTDYNGWSEYSQDLGQLWCEDCMNALLAEHTEGALFISGTDGKTAEQREEIIDFVQTVEPLLRAGANYEMDTRKPLDQVATELELIARQLEHPVPMHRKKFT